MNLELYSGARISREKRFHIRRSLLVIFSITFIFFFFGFWSLQIVQNDYFKRLSLRNIIRTLPLEAPRGKIYDRQGMVLAENQLQFSLKFIRENVNDLESSLQKAVKFSGKTPEQLKALLDKYRYYPAFFPITIRNNLSLQNVIYLSARSEDFPEFEIFFSPYRRYPLQNSAAHIIGYIGEITDAELQSEKAGNYHQGDLIGKFGLEKRYERYLRGEKGEQTVIKDFQERTQQVIAERQPQIGADLQLTIDLELQQFVEKELSSLRGTVAVVELQEGGILALVSKPNFDPEEFIELSSERWQKIVADPFFPLQNRFIQGLYSPGSVFKIVMALAGLEEKVINAGNTFFCSGVTYIYDNPFRCWFPGGHGEVNVVEALEKSCNIFFYNLGKKLDIDVIARYARLLGLGVKTGIDLDEEKEGLFPDSRWKLRKTGQKWFPGETISVAIGQGQISVTPAQLLQMISIIALRGNKVQFHLVNAIKRDGAVVWKPAVEVVRLPLSKENIEIVIEGLARVVNSGTGVRARHDQVEICGKTGTAQVISKKNPLFEKVKNQEIFKPHSWFVSFAPRQNPRYAMVILIENGGNAGAIAAPLATRIYDHLFFKR